MREIARPFHQSRRRRRRQIDLLSSPSRWSSVDKSLNEGITFHSINVCLLVRRKERVTFIFLFLWNMLPSSVDSSALPFWGPRFESQAYHLRFTTYCQILYLYIYRLYIVSIFYIVFYILYCIYILYIYIVSIYILYLYCIDIVSIYIYIVCWEKNENKPKGGRVWHIFQKQVAQCIISDIKTVLQYRRHRRELRPWYQRLLVLNNNDSISINNNNNSKKIPSHAS